MFLNLSLLSDRVNPVSYTHLFARILLEAFGGANGELTSAMQYFVQAFSCHNPFPDKYDMLMDIATEELTHLEIVGATIQMLLGPVNGKMKDAVETMEISKLMEGKSCLLYTSANTL